MTGEGFFRLASTGRQDAWAAGCSSGMKAAGERKAKKLACDCGGGNCEWCFCVSLLPCERCLDGRDANARDGASALLREGE